MTDNLAPTLRAIAEAAANMARGSTGFAPVLLITGGFGEYLAFLVATGLREDQVIYVHNLAPLKMYAPGPGTQIALYGHYWDNPIFSEELQDAALFYLELHSDTPLDQSEDCRHDA